MFLRLLIRPGKQFSFVVRFERSAKSMVTLEQKIDFIESRTGGYVSYIYRWTESFPIAQQCIVRMMVLCRGI